MRYLSCLMTKYLTGSSLREEEVLGSQLNGNSLSWCKKRAKHMVVHLGNQEKS